MVLFGGLRFDIVEFEFDVAPARRASFSVTDRFLVVESLDPAPPKEHRDAVLVGRIWPVSGWCRAVAASGSPTEAHLTLQVDHGRIFSYEYREAAAATSPTEVR